MKPIKILETEDVILIDDINSHDHIAVGIINGIPCIYGKEFSSPQKNATFLIIGGYNLSTISIGNSFPFPGDTMGQAIKCAMGGTNKIEIFKKENWRDALHWLIDNAD